MMISRRHPIARAVNGLVLTVGLGVISFIAFGRYGWAWGLLYLFASILVATFTIRRYLREAATDSK
jgi:hypothetical protein